MFTGCALLRIAAKESFISRELTVGQIESRRAPVFPRAEEIARAGKEKNVGINIQEWGHRQATT